MRFLSTAPAQPKALIGPGRTIRRRDGVRYWMAIALLMLGFCGASVLMLAELRRDSWTLANDGATNLLTVLSKDIESNIRAYDRILAGVAAKLREPELAGFDPRLQQALLFEGALIEPYFTSLLVLDSAGNVVRDAGAFPPRSDNFADRAYFRFHAENRSNDLFVSPPFQRRLTGDDEVLGLSRRLEAPDGSFAGVVVGTLRLGYFRELFGQAHLNPGDAINLISQDGILLMRSPYRADQIGRDLSASDNIRRFRAAASGTFTGISTIDGVKRVYNFTHVGDLPLILNVALSHDEIFAVWRARALTIGGALACLCILTTVLGFAARRQFVRRARAEAMTRESETQYRLLADHATDVIVRLDGDLTRRYVSPASRTMLGSEPAELMGRNILDLIHPDDRPLVEMIAQAVRMARAPAEAIYRIRHRGGHYVWVEARYSLVVEDGGFIVVLRDVTRRKAAEAELAAAHAELARRADTDGLTGLANRRRFDEALDAKLKKAGAGGKPVSLLLIDVDRFKLFNDTYGHQAGDDCLRGVARAIEGAVRAGDLCARYGGEEIAVVLPATSEAEACRMGARIRDAVERLAIAHARGIGGRVTVSIGCASRLPGSGEGAVELVGAADRLLYEAKRTGRNKVLSAAAFAAETDAPDAPGEERRLEAVRTYLDAIGGSQALDDFARSAAELLGAPIGFLSLVGRTELTIVGRHGIDIRTVPRDAAFCTHAIAGDEPLVIHDALADPRFRDSPLTKGEGAWRFYAGAPLVDPQSGMTIGALCVADIAPRDGTNARDREALAGLSKRAMAVLAADRAGR